MTHSSQSPRDNFASLLSAIAIFPESWALTPCIGKQNFWPGWQREKLDRETLRNAIANQTNHEGKHCTWTGVSVVTGPLSGGLMAVDFDGPLAFDKYVELSGGQLPPRTKRWTSGKPGHFQILLQVPPLAKGELKPQKIELDGGQKLELRWNQCSTLPPSIHPDTGKPYFWKNNEDVAECPDFILALMREAPAVELPKKSVEKDPIYIDVEKSLVELLKSDILPRLTPEEFYGEWVALKPSGQELKGLCPFHQEKTASFTVSQNCLYHCFGCGVGGGPVEFLHQIKGGSGSPTGKDFAGIVRELAARVGVQMPDRKLATQNLKSPIPSLQGSNILKHPATANYVETSPAEAEEIIERVDRLLGEDLSPTNEIIKATAAAKQIGLSPKDLRELLVVRQVEQDLDWSILNSVSKFKQLHQIQNSQIDLREFFPPALAKALLSKATSDRIDPVRIVQSLLPVVGTMLGARVGIVLKPGAEGDDDWVEYPIFYTVDISPPSTGKSATQGSILKPLKKMQASAQERLEEALIELEQIEENWRGLSKEERAEKFDSEENPRVYMERHCKVRKWIFNRASAQALTKRIAEQQPMQGCLLLQDELAGFLTSFDQFTGGKGGEEEFLLEAWNGPIEGSVDRVDIKSNSYTFKRQTLSVTGTMQPGIARKVFNTTADPNGMLSRFLPAISNIPDNFATWSNVTVNINRAMTELIENLERVPETLLTLPGPTEEIYKSYWEKIREAVKLNLEENPAYSFFIGKQVGYVGRFAIALHCIENLSGGEIPTRVSPETMTRAIRLSLFYCNQFLLLQSKSAQQQPIEGILLDILKFAREKGGQISTRDLCRSRFKNAEVEGKKITGFTAGKLLKGIADAGFGFYKECGNSRILTVLSPTVTDCHHTVTSLKTSDSKDLNVDCHQKTEVYISKISDRTEDITEAFIEESDTPTSVENIHFCHSVTVEAENHVLKALEVGDSPVTVGDSGDSSKLNQDEIELLEMLHQAVVEGNAYFAQQVRDILREVCARGAADRKKVWAALSDQEQKKFTELVKVEISPEVGHIIESMQTILGSSDDPNEIDHLFLVYSPELIDRTTELLRTDDKAKILRWIGIRDLAAALVEAIPAGPRAIHEAAATHFYYEEVEAAIARLEHFKEWDAVEKIRQALFSESGNNLAAELAAAFCEPTRLREIVAANSAEAVERAIAEIEEGDEEMADEIRDLLS